MLSRFRSQNSAPAPSLSQALSSLRALLKPENDHEINFLTDDCLTCYLHARDLNVSKAHTMLLATLAWRKSYAVDDLLQSNPLSPSLRQSASTGKMYVLPKKDRTGNAVIVMRPGYENSSDDVQNVRFLVYTLERASALAPDGKFTVIVDYFSGNFSLSNSPGVSVMKETVSILQNHYPERLGAALLFDAPKFFLALFKLVRPFIDTKTKEKISFVKSESAAQDQDCSRVLDFQNTPEEYGGNVPFQFHVDDYFRVDSQSGP